MKCIHAATCKYRMRYGDTKTGCTAKSSRRCAAAKWNGRFYPVVHVLKVEQKIAAVEGIACP